VASEELYKASQAGASSSTGGQATDAGAGQSSSQQSNKKGSDEVTDVDFEEVK
jgi:hypothetical protein